MGKKGNMGKASVSSNVTNISNTGVRNTSTQRTGATGDEINRIHEVTIQGTPGMPGRQESVVIPTPGGTTPPAPGTPNLPDYDLGPNPYNTVLDQAQNHVTNTFDQADMAVGRLPAEQQATVRAQLNAARARVTAQLGTTRTTANDAWSKASALRRQYGR